MTQNASHQIFVAEGFVKEALLCGRNKNVDVDAMLNDLQISGADLSKLSARDFAKIWLELSRRMDDEFFGLGKRPLRPGSTTLLGHAVRGATSFETALRRMIRFLEVCIEDPHGTVRITDQDCHIRLHENEGPRSPFAYRAFFLILHGFSCWLAKERIPIKRIEFPCPEPDERNDYGDFFGVPVTFNAKQGLLTYDKKFLSRPVKRSEVDLKHFLRRTPETLVRGYRDTGTLKQKIISKCYSGSAEEWPDAAGVAKTLKISRSTLHRSLRAESQSISSIKDELRRSKALLLLKTSDLTISEIADHLGYAEESAFYRAFKTWFGATPASFRPS